MCERKSSVCAIDKWKLILTARKSVCIKHWPWILHSSLAHASLLVFIFSLITFISMLREHYAQLYVLRLRCVDVANITHSRKTRHTQKHNFGILSRLSPGWHLQQYRRLGRQRRWRCRWCLSDVRLPTNTQMSSDSYCASTSLIYENLLCLHSLKYLLLHVYIVRSYCMYESKSQPKW